MLSRNRYELLSVRLQFFEKQQLTIDFAAPARSASVFIPDLNPLIEDEKPEQMCFDRFALIVSSS